MRYENRIICFIDILNFRNHVNETIDADEDIENKIKLIFDALNEARNILDVDDNLNRNELIKNITHFSDSFIISFHVETEHEVYSTLVDLQCLIVSLISKGFLCRGGITSGKIIHNKEVIFGPGFITAYDMETKAAIYPRVILDEKVKKMALKYHANYHDSEKEQEWINGIITQDEDGMWYIDYFSKSAFLDIVYPKYLEKLREIIVSNLDNCIPDIKVKYGWLKNKFNKMMSSITDEYKIKSI